MPTVKRINKNIEPVTLHGVTRPFAGNGRKLGYPTANILTSSSLKDGVYLGFVTLGKFKNRPALIFIGTPITVGDTERRLETHLLEIPDDDYYGQKQTVTISHYMRPNYTFKTVSDLKRCMDEDAVYARSWFNGNLP